MANITCTTPEDQDNVFWSIQNNGQTQRITDGTEASVSKDSKNSMVNVNRTSEIWKGRLYPKE